MFFSVVVSGGTGTMFAQNTSHAIGLKLAKVVTEDAGLNPGMTLTLDVQTSGSTTSLREGVVEGFLAEGLTVYEEESKVTSQIRLSVIPRGVYEGSMKISVVGVSQSDGHYMFSRAYAIPVEETTLVESLLAPVIVTASAVLVVYLLLTVRSS